MFHAAGLYPNTPHDEGTEAKMKYLNDRCDKIILKGNLCKLYEFFWNQKFFEIGNKFSSDQRKRKIANKVAPPMSL